MICLRLARGYRLFDLARWLLSATAAAVVASFLLRALGLALTGQPGGTPLFRLVWCLPPLASVAWFAGMAARALPALRPERIVGLTAAGAGPGRIRVLVATETALACALGSGLTLLVFLILRNDIAGPSLAADLGMGVPLPAVAPVTLLLLIPLAAGLSAAGAVPVGEALPGSADRPLTLQHHPLRLALPIGLALIGVTLELYGLRPDAAEDGRPVRLPAGLGSTSTAAITGWLFAAVGLTLLTVPLLGLAGRALALGRPTPLRLLAGRALTAEAARLGTPLAVLALTAAVVLTVIRHWVGRSGTAEPLPAAEGALMVACTVAAVLARAIEVRTARRDTTDALVRLGAAPRLLTGAAALRTVAAGTVLLVTGGLVAVLGAAALG